MEPKEARRSSKKLAVVKSSGSFGGQKANDKTEGFKGQ